MKQENHSGRTISAVTILKGIKTKHPAKNIFYDEASNHVEDKIAAANWIYSYYERKM